MHNGKRVLSKLFERELCVEQYMALSKDLSKNKQNEEALETLWEAVEHFPRDYRLWYELGHKFKNVGLYDKALRALNKALEIKPGDEITLQTLEEFESILTYSNILEKHVTAVCYSMEAKQLNKQKSYPEALRLLEEATKNFPENHVLLFQFGIGLSYARRYEEALKAFDSGLKIDPDNEKITNARMATQHYQAKQSAHKKNRSRHYRHG